MDIINTNIKKNINKDDVIYFLIEKISELLSLNTCIKPNVYKKYLVGKLKSLNIFDDAIDYKDKSSLISQIINSEFQKIIKSTHASGLKEFINDDTKTVFKMYNQLDECVYAIKKLEWIDDSMLQEIRIMSKLHHENVVRYHNAWVQSIFSTQMICDTFVDSKNINDTKYVMLQMELCKCDLKQYLISNKELSLQNKINICIQIGNGVKYIHLKNIVHMDIKPENILYGFDGLFKISDFGLSKKVESKRITLTDEDYIGGTFGYAAPELYEGQSFSKKADIYSLGMTFLYIFTNPFTMMEYLNNYNKLKSGELIVISNKITNLLLKMLSKECNRPSISDIIFCLAEDLHNKSHQLNLSQLEKPSRYILYK